MGTHPKNLDRDGDQGPAKNSRFPRFLEAFGTGVLHGRNPWIPVMAAGIETRLVVKHGAPKVSLSVCQTGTYPIP